MTDRMLSLRRLLWLLLLAQSNRRALLFSLKEASNTDGDRRVLPLLFPHVDPPLVSASRDNAPHLTPIHMTSGHLKPVYSVSRA